MKLLTATALTQGHRDNDFTGCVEGELVHISLICATGREDPDGGCGCGRAFAGLNSHRGTTTALVRDVEEFTREDYVEALRSSLEQQGWNPAVAEEEADRLSRLAEHFPTGAVLERRLDQIAARTLVQP